MSRSLILLFFYCSANCASSQELKIIHTNLETNEILKRAISGADSFLQMFFTPEIFRKHVVLNENACTIVYNDYKTSFTVLSSDERPIRYEIDFDVLIEKDTLFDAFYVPIDSSGRVQFNRLKDDECGRSYKAHKKLLSGQYRFGYGSLMKFIKQKGVKNYDFYFGPIGRMKRSSHYPEGYCWLLNDYDRKMKDKNKRVIQYQIDPVSSKIRIHSLKGPVLIPKDAE